jgi:hypothetical protein
MSFCINTHAVNCGRAIPPANGYINNYTSTLEGANVIFTCNRSIDDQILTEHVASCNANGSWDPNPFEFCMDTHQNGMYIQVRIIHGNQINT